MEAIVYIHDQKIIHRDLKPSNIMISEDDKQKIKLLDFGLSYIKQTFSPLSNGKMGTCLFIAPEVAKGIDYTNVSLNL